MHILEKCPFCPNGKPKIRKIGNGYAVQCTCGARGPWEPIRTWHDHKFIAQGKAVAAWNQRSDK